MAKWTPPMTPTATYEVAGSTIDAGETCTNVVRKDGTAIDPGAFQDLFEAAITLNQLMSGVTLALASISASVTADTETGKVTVVVAEADLQSAQSVVTSMFGTKPVVVEANG